MGEKRAWYTLSAHVSKLLVICGAVGPGAAMEKRFEDAIAYALPRLGCSSLTLKKDQTEALKAVYDKNDVFLWLPTGFGKSICYECVINWEEQILMTVGVPY